MGQSASQNSNNAFHQDTEVFLPEIGQRRPVESKSFKHPMAALFHVVFKTLAFLFYLFGGLFGQDFKSTFVAVILLISMDFWVVKNVTGRLLAGLRWSNYIDDDGNSHWIFENKNQLTANQGDKLSSFQEEISGDNRTADTTIFWLGLILAPIIWTLLMLVSIFRLNVQWFMLVTLASVLSASNFYGYARCRLGTSDIKTSVTQFVAKQMFYNFITGGSATNKSMA